jgi:cephalosporin hydroxylase
MSAAINLISGDDLKTAALQYSAEIKLRVAKEQGGMLGIFDGWFARTVSRLLQFDPSQPWEDSVRDQVARSPQALDLQWDLMRLRQFLDRRRQGRFVSFTEREKSAIFYHPRFGTEFGPDVQLTCQGAPALLRWRDTPLMKNVFDFAMYPALIADIRPLTVFEIGSGLGASAAWFADIMASCGIEGRVYSVDRVKAKLAHPQVTFGQADCAEPSSLFDPEILHSRPHPWLVIEDAHSNVAAVLEYVHRFLRPGDYLVVEDTDIKRGALREFIDAHPNEYLVDTKFTDNFGRNATCAADGIFIKTSSE